MAAVCFQDGRHFQVDINVLPYEMIHDSYILVFLIESYDTDTKQSTRTKFWIILNKMAAIFQYGRRWKQLITSNSNIECWIDFLY